MKTTNWKTWAKAALIRAIRTFAEAMLAYIGTGALVLGDVNWLAALSAGGFGFITAILLGLGQAGHREQDSGDRPARGRAGIKLNTACSMPRSGSNSSSGAFSCFWENTPFG